MRCLRLQVLLLLLLLLQLQITHMCCMPVRFPAMTANMQHARYVMIVLSVVELSVRCAPAYGYHLRHLMSLPTIADCRFSTSHENGIKSVYSSAGS